MKNNRHIKWIEKIKTAPKNKLKIAIWIIAIFLFVVSMTGLFLYGNFLTFFLLFDSIVETIAQMMNIDIWLARIMAIFIGVMFLYFVSPYIFSLNNKKRRSGYLIVGIIFIILFAGAYLANKDNAFMPDGSARKCMAWNPMEGKYDDDIPCNYKVHPKYGTEVMPVSKEMIAIKNTMQNGPGQFKRIIPHKNLRFFAPDGSPLIWYYQRPDGKLELFGNKGSHPQLQVILSPINGEVAALIIKYLEERKYNMIIADGQISNTGYNEQQTGLSASDVSALQELRDLLSALRR